MMKEPIVVTVDPEPKPNHPFREVPIFGTPEYKKGLVYLYCKPEDKARAKHFSKVLHCSMKQVVHKLMFAAEIAVANPGMPVMVVTFNPNKSDVK